MSDEEVQRYLAETSAARARRPIKSRHALVTIGSMTERDGRVVTASTGIGIIVNGERLRVACVGDTVRYANGTETVITSGAGCAMRHEGRPVAIVGSHLANGDTITHSRQSSHHITQFADEEPIQACCNPATLRPPEACINDSWLDSIW
jgi:uncharacterized Zn-binding protein involved in type VI secretion